MLHTGTVYITVTTQFKVCSKLQKPASVFDMAKCVLCIVSTHVKNRSSGINFFKHNYLGSLMVIALCGPMPHHLGSSSLEGVVYLLHGITEVVSISDRIS